MNPVDILKLHYNVTDNQAAKLKAFHKLVTEANFNLTSITDDYDFAIKHFLDSTTVLPYIKPNANVVDIGSGAGFPGIVIAIMLDVNITLLEARKKRADFLQSTIEALHLKNATVVCKRAEETKNLQYNVCTARAVAPLPKLIKYAMPLLAKGGLFIAMKSRDAENELAATNIKKHGGNLINIAKIELIEGMHRSLVLIEKK